MFKAYFKNRGKNNNQCYRYPCTHQLDLSDINIFPYKFSLSRNKFLGNIPICKRLYGNELFEDEGRLIIPLFFCATLFPPKPPVFCWVLNWQDSIRHWEPKQVSTISESTRIKTSEYTNRKNKSKLQPYFSSFPSLLSSSPFPSFPSLIPPLFFLLKELLVLLFTIYKTIFVLTFLFVYIQSDFRKFVIKNFGLNSLYLQIILNVYLLHTLR